MTVPPGGIPEERGEGEARRSSRPEKTPLWPLRARLKVSFVFTQSRTPSHVFWRRPQKGSQKSNECTDPQSCTCIVGALLCASRCVRPSCILQLACGLVQLVFDLASSLLSLSLYPFPSSLPFPFFLLTRPRFPPQHRSSFLRPPREHSKNWRRLLSSPLLSLSFSLEPRRSHEQCSSTLVCRDLNLDNLTCANPWQKLRATRHARPFHRRNRRGEERIPSPEVDARVISNAFHPWKRWIPTTDRWLARNSPYCKSLSLLILVFYG